MKKYIKKIIASALAISLSISTAMSVMASDIMYGDANSDSRINVMDAVTMKKYIAGFEGLTIDITACDVTCDSRINVMDAVKLLKWIAGFDVVLGESNVSTDSGELEVARADYFGIEVEESVAAVSPDALDWQIESDLEAHAKEERITYGTVEEDMNVDIDYVATVGSEIYDSEEGYVLTVDDWDYIMDGFNESLIGREVGERYGVTLQIPDYEYYGEYAGQNVIYTVEINAIVNYVVPELTNEYVQEFYSYKGILTVDKYMEYMQDEIRNEHIYYEIWGEVLDNVEVVEYDQAQLEKMTGIFVEFMKYLLESFGYTFEEYLDEMEMTESDFVIECEEMAKQEVKEIMLCKHIVENENITYTEEEFDIFMMEGMEAEGVESEEELYELYAQFGADDEFFENAFIVDIATEFVCENVVVIPDAE